MKIISWNINGLRKVVNTNILIDLKCDILCLSETRLPKKKDNILKYIDDTMSDYKYKYYNDCDYKSGYSGTCVLSKIEPINVMYGSDNEGRMITLEFNDYYLINCYTPNSGAELKRLKYRINEWDVNFSNFISTLNKNVIICGDLNVAHYEIDLANPENNTNTAGYTIDERNSFTKLLKKNKLIDVYRYMYPNKRKYTFWSYRGRCRNNNIGWRIDYFLVNKKYIKNIIKCKILSKYLSSDHAPIILYL